MKKKQQNKLPRRNFLRGGAGAALALPFLEYFHSEAKAQEGPKRLIVCYSGQAMGGDGDRRRHGFVPEREGALTDMALPASLLPLGGRELWDGRYGGDRVEPIRNWEGTVADVRSEVSVLTGMRIPLNGTAKAASYHHRGTISPQLSGTSSNNRSPDCNGETADVIAERGLGGGEAMRCLVQAGHYGNGGRNDHVMSWRRNGGGGMEPVFGQVSPRTMYQALFEGRDLGGTDPAAALAAERLARRRRSVLDLVLPSAQRLRGRLGVEDRRRLEQHMDSVTTIRARLDQMMEDGIDSACFDPGDPGEDPRYTGGAGGDRSNFRAGEGWSEEQRRSEAFIDMIVMAMACGMTNTATLMFSYHQSFINALAATGLNADTHALGHFGAPVNGSNNASMSLMHHYPVRYFGYLVHRLRETEIAPGRSLLDDCAAGLFFEAGHGNYEGSVSSHSGDDMACLVAGRAGGLVGGQHIACDGEPPAKALTSMLAAVGLDARLGEISGTMPGLI